MDLVPVTDAVLRIRQRRVARIASTFGFVGTVEYRHEFSKSGGAQYRRLQSPSNDSLVVYAEAFEREAEGDFSLEAMIAHERGHQLIVRHPRISRNLPVSWSNAAEEIIASIIGSLLVSRKVDSENLLLKATFDATEDGIEYNRALLLISEIRGILEKML